MKKLMFIFLCLSLSFFSLSCSQLSDSVKEQSGQNNESDVIEPAESVQTSEEINFDDNLGEFNLVASKIP